MAGFLASMAELCEDTIWPEASLPHSRGAAACVLPAEHRWPSWAPPSAWGSFFPQGAEGTGSKGTVCAQA